MSLSLRVTHSLRILGLSPGASASEVRSAFRRLARTCHPDVAGRQGARRFEQITGAYTFLKSLSQEELRQSTVSNIKSTAPSAAQKASRWGWETPWTWRQRRRERLRMEEEQRRHAAQEAEEQARETREARMDNVLRRGEQAIEAILSRMDREIRNGDIQDLILRLSSEIMEVRHLALSRLGALGNRRELLDAVIALLLKRDIDEKTARLVAALPLEPAHHRKMAEILAERAAAIPDHLLIFLLHLRSARAVDRELRERYVRNARPGGVALILRHWPEGAFLSAATLRILLSREEEAVLIPLLSAMKQRAVLCPAWGYERLKSLLTHSNVAVRVWAKALLPKGVA